MPGHLTKHQDRPTLGFELTERPVSKLPLHLLCQDTKIWGHMSQLGVIWTASDAGPEVAKDGRIQRGSPLLYHIRFPQSAKEVVT